MKSFLFCLQVIHLTGGLKNLDEILGLEYAVIHLTGGLKMLNVLPMNGVKVIHLTGGLKINKN
ncbi:hypothetical protein DBT89_RS25985 [Vibrio parahaemolyticus]|nr:hypothetical protein [Vibrio parahaemolyticus]